LPPPTNSSSTPSFRATAPSQKKKGENVSFSNKEKKALFLASVESHDLQTVLKHIMLLLQHHAVQPRYARNTNVILYGVNARRLTTKLNALQTWFKHRNFLTLMDLKEGAASAKLHLVVDALFDVWRDLKDELTLLKASNGLPDKHPASAHISEANALAKNLRKLEINFRVYHQARTCGLASKDDLLAFLDAMVGDARSDKLCEIAQFCLVPRFSYPGEQAVTAARKKLHAELALRLGDAAACEVESSEVKADEDGFMSVGPNPEDNPNMARAVVESVDNNYDVRIPCACLPRRGSLPPLTHHFPPLP
jgi:hypothetical protein